LAYLSCPYRKVPQVRSEDLNPEREQFLKDLLAAGRAHDAALADRRARLRNVEPETARMMVVLVRAIGARRVLELGTSNGYSTVWLADASAGRVLTVECDMGRARQARETFLRAGVAAAIELAERDAGDVLAEQADRAFDFVFLDAERSEYMRWWPDLLRTLDAPGVIVVDNVISHADEVKEFRALVDAEPAVTSALVPVGAGTLLIARATEASQQPNPCASAAAQPSLRRCCWEPPRP
jgi:predicted O-methyltransferase YrrM